MKPDLKQLGIAAVILILLVTCVFFLVPGPECFGADACNPTGSPIGGGEGYTRIVSETDTGVKYVVSTKDQLLVALQNAQMGETVFVQGTAVINMTGAPVITIPAGVTLASDRGRGDSQGALIKKNHIRGINWERLFVAGDGVRITGLRLEGEMRPQNDASVPDREYMTGIHAFDALEVDNCEIRGWSYAAVMVGNLARPGGSGYIHHNYIHSNQAAGEGCGVAIVGGAGLIEANIFDYNRHSIAGAGIEGESYEARYNHVLGHGNPGLWHFDVHRNRVGGTYSGDFYKIHHNTFDTPSDPSVRDIAFQGGIPESGIWIDHNIFEWPDLWEKRPVIHINASAKSRMHVINNLAGIPPMLIGGAEGVITFPAEDISNESDFLFNQSGFQILYNTSTISSAPALAMP